MYALSTLIEMLKHHVATTAGVDASEVEVVDAPESTGADLAVPCFAIAKKLGKNPNELAEELAEKVASVIGKDIASIVTANGYINVKLNRAKFAAAVVRDAANKAYGTSTVGSGKTIISEFSSPNIAKPFSVGHLRSTIIGDATSYLYKALGYKVINENYLGDWGTQFGKLIVAYKKWGNEEAVKTYPIEALNDLYVKFHEEVGDERGENDEQGDHPFLIEARAWFKKLEDGDAEAKKLWQWFYDLSIKEFEKIYQTLGIHFDQIRGESHYVKGADKLIDLLVSKKITKQEQDGALIVPLEKFNIKPPLLVKKSDGATLYATRELARAVALEQEFHPTEIHYIVGADQTFHFSQVFPVLSLLGIKAKLVHIEFGFVQMKGADEKLEKMSTRRGKVVLLEKLLDEAVKRAAAILKDREMDAKTKEEVAKIIGIGAIKFNDLGQNRRHNITFDWERMLALDGYSGPYLQYSVARARSILQKAGPAAEASSSPQHADLVFGDEEWPLIKVLARYPLVIEEAARAYEPHRLCEYLFGLAQAFSAYYQKVPVLKSPDAATKATRLALVGAVANTLERGLALLGIEVPKQM